ncbi:MAG: HK97-gp10 family putative phage morphogenesis protein [Acidovorax sp.]
MAKEEILGLGDLSANFKKLKTDMEQRTGRAMVVAGGSVVKRRAKANVQQLGLVRTGAYLKNIVIKREPQNPPGTVAYALGVRHGRNLTKKQKANSKLGVEKGRIVKRYEDDPFYWRFLEFDTSKRDGTPAIGPALEEGRGEAIDAMGNRLQKELDKAGSK